jgi:hypothetical protein
MPTFDERACEQVYAAIERGAKRELVGTRDHSELERLASVAVGLAIMSVQCLAEERGTSVEAVLDQLIERAP